MKNFLKTWMYNTGISALVCATSVAVIALIYLIVGTLVSHGILGYVILGVLGFLLCTFLTTIADVGGFK